MRMSSSPKRLFEQDFRSTLEAQYAAFFDLIGCDWEYEMPWDEELSPIGWLPDFVLWPCQLSQLTDRVLVEVKPPMTRWQIQALTKRLDRAWPRVPRGYCTAPIWITSGGLGHLGTETEGNVPLQRKAGLYRGGYGGARTEDEGLSEILFSCLAEEGLAPFGENQLRLLNDRERNELFVPDYEQDFDLLLPIGYESWAGAWREAERIVKSEGVSIPPPANPRERVDILNDDTGPDCGLDKNPGFMLCRECADAEWYGR